MRVSVNVDYNRIAGQSAERLAALSDGVFAVAMTLLVLDLHAPAVETIHTERYLWRALGALAPRLIPYVMSFITLGIFSIMQWEINLTVIAALLTLVGYSMNDTIVIFDRIREMMRVRRRDTLEHLANEAINQTLSRTIITSGLTFLTVLSLLLFGGEVLKSFSWALFIGIIVGTYSSIYIASPFMLWWEHFKKQPKLATVSPSSGARSADIPSGTGSVSGSTMRCSAASTSIAAW